jgi:uncharacterized protein DUF6916
VELSLQQVSLGDFSPHLGTRFQVDLDGQGALEVELIEAVALRPRSGGRISLRSEPFSLVMRGPLSPVLNQRIHRLSHEALGKIEVFLVPIGPDEVGQRYEAIFN